ncbi:Bifunctional inhibitor/lipid-transfer protein/seed storage 2S albumin protein [Dioscorea alata]|uniref:Bifunctional inhibitor/lipid-transfer protein/seed storage 2S albumin protein n=1 Tax=Dioscorea alata TaxID=55571 RepID=A0ACB7UGK0_DIOAL|nr:Bifunctional inhibitor/lipid-transfer protein/seed storage 2S albumin protein [Dioscorea alata]
MASSKSSTSIYGLFLIFNLLFFTFGTSQTLPLVTPAASPPASPAPGNGGQCIELGVCVALLESLLNITIGPVPKEPCCSLIPNVLDLEAAVCLCVQIRTNLLGITNLDIDLAFTLFVNNCGKVAPSGFQCPKQIGDDEAGSPVSD